jgi:glutamine---fructose-6-phosphate transaminase (isomerizing)
MMNKFLNEIYEQPVALENTLNFYLHGEGQAGIDKISDIREQGKFKQILFTGMGSSFFAPNSVSCLLNNNGFSSHYINTGELLHYNFPLISKEVLLVCISQSGESYEIVRLLEKIPEGVKVIGITNEENSTLARKAGITLLCRAGKEEMTSSKTYVATLLVLSIFARVITGKWAPGIMPELKDVINATEKLINTSNEWLAPVMDFLDHPSFVQVIGRGPSFSSVLQGALMIMEAARNPSAGILGGEFRHGPMEMIRKGFRAVIFAPQGATFDQAIKLAEDITKSGGRVVLLTNNADVADNPDILKVFIPCQDEFLFPIPSIIPLQFIVNQWAEDKGNEAGNFIMGSKVTTTE